MTGFTNVCCVLFLVMLASGCAHGRDDAICVEPANETLYVTVTNQSNSIIAVPGDTPHIGCCNIAGLAIAITDANGKELKRCARSDAFSEPSLVSLSPSESKRYALSEMTVRSIYCNVDLKEHFVTTRLPGNKDGQHFSSQTNPVRLCRPR